MNRLAVLAVRLRSGVVWALPLLAVATLMALLVTFAIVSINSTKAREAQTRTLRHVEDIAAQAKVSAEQAKVSSKAAEDASKVNTDLLNHYKPCLPEDDPESPQCQRARVVSDAIAQIQGQHDEVLRSLRELLSRPAAQRTTVVREAAPVSPGVRAAPSGTSTAPGAPAATQPAPETTTTSACDQRGKSGRCK